MSRLLNFFKDPKPDNATSVKTSAFLTSALGKAGFTAEDLATAETADNSDFLSRSVSEAANALSTAKAAADANAIEALGKVASATANLKLAGINLTAEEVASDPKVVASAIEAVVSRRVVDLAASRGIPPVNTTPKGGDNKKLTLTEQCLEANRKN